MTASVRDVSALHGASESNHTTTTTPMDTDAEDIRMIPSPSSMLSDASSGALQSDNTAPAWWFDDGNVVLIAEDTLFRVHRGILSHHSVVFRDMFLIPQPEELEKIDGCPVVHLSDGQRELGVLLSALYDGYRCVSCVLCVRGEEKLD